MWITFCKSTIGKVCNALNEVFQTFMNVSSHLYHSWLFLICYVCDVSSHKKEIYIEFYKKN